MPIMRAHIRTVRIRRTAAAICAILMPLALTAMSPAPVRGLLWPIDRPQRITGTFCEPRGSRFHLGIDVSTAGKKGFAVNAAITNPRRCRSWLSVCRIEEAMRETSKASSSFRMSSFSIMGFCSWFKIYASYLTGPALGMLLEQHFLADFAR